MGDGHVARAECGLVARMSLSVWFGTCFLRVTHEVLTWLLIALYDTLDPVSNAPHMRMSTQDNAFLKVCPIERCRI